MFYYLCVYRDRGDREECVILHLWAQIHQNRLTLISTITLLIAMVSCFETMQLFSCEGV